MPSLTDIILSTSSKYGVDPALLYATIMTESSGNPQAQRYEPHLDESSYGLGQLLESTARGLGYQGPAQGLFDPATNLDYTTRYLLQARQQGAQTPQQYATFYNTGRLGGTPTEGHLQRFMQNYQQYPQAQTQAANLPRPNLNFSTPQAASSASLSQAASPSQRSYVVRPGDTLSGIAQRLGLPSYRAFSGYRSGNANLIYPGEVIKWA